MHQLDPFLLLKDSLSWSFSLLIDQLSDLFSMQTIFHQRIQSQFLGILNLLFEMTIRLKKNVQLFFLRPTPMIFKLMQTNSISTD